MQKLYKWMAITLLMVGIPLGASSQNWEYGTPFDTAAPPAAYLHVQNSVPLTYMMDSLKYPYPTTNWFKCLFLSKHDPVNQNYPDSMVGWSPVFPYPYAIGLGSMPVPGYISYSSAKNRLATGYRPYQLSVQTSGVPGTNAVTFSSGFDWYFGVANGSGTPDAIELKPFIRTYDDLSVTLKYRQVSGAAGFMEAPIVKGMPYTTMIYSGLVPYIASQARTLLAYSTDGTTFTPLPNPNPVTIKSNRFILKMAGDGGADRCIYWVLFISDSVEVDLYFDYMNSHPGSQFQGAVFFKSPFSGFVRAAYLASNIAAVGTMPEYIDTANMAAKLSVLTRYAKFYPTGGTFKATIDEGSDIAQLKFSWQTNHPSNDSLLMFALPHHLDILVSATQTDNILTQYKTIKGNLKGVFGKNWVMNEPLVTVKWISEDHNLSENSLGKYRDRLWKTLQGDRDTIAGATAFGPGFLNQINNSTYFGGKQLAKKGRLAVIADEMAAWYPGAVPLAKDIRDTLKSELNRWLDCTDLLILPNSGWQQNHLRYETNYGGIVNSIDLNSVGGDFGNSVYTDHHFHYGYFLYTAAAIAKGDTDWAALYRNKILLLARDIANPAKADKYFVKDRLKDWYDGHCWAQGLSDAAGVGNNQESTSESANAWYSMYLLGIALGDKNLENTGRLYLSTEIRAAQKYWQIGPVSHYPAAYTDLYKVVGNLYASSINSLVAFGDPGDPMMVYGIQQIPATPVNIELLNEPWCDSIFNFYYRGSSMYKSPATQLELQWATVNLASISISKPGHAYGYFSKYLDKYTYYSTGSTRNITNYDDGESKTNVLYTALVDAGSNVQKDKVWLDVRALVIAHDTLGECKGEVLVEVLNGDAADPPYHYFLLPDGTEEEAYYDQPEIGNLCAGQHLLEVIDGEFNIGYTLVTIKNMTSIPESGIEAGVKIYPNPSVDGRFTADWSEAGITPESLVVANTMGQPLFHAGSVFAGTQRMELDLQNQPAGVYLLTITFAGGRQCNLKLIRSNK